MNDVIKSYLVSLGFGVDETSLGKFNAAIEKASTRVLALYGAVQTAAAGIFYSMTQISKGFEEMGYEYKIIAPAINKALILRRELLRAYQSAGVNIVKVIQQSVRFNLSLTKTQYALKALYTSVASRFFPLLTKQLDIFRSKIYANMPRIQEALEKMIKFIFKAFEATVILGQRLFSILGRVYDFFVKLDEKTNGWSTIVLGLVAAWKLLNLSFLATPLGALIAGFVALLALFDDFKTWQEGGKSLFDWTDAVPVIDAVTKSLSEMYKTISGILYVAKELVLAIKDLLNFNLSKVGEHLLNANSSLGENLYNFGKNNLESMLKYGPFGPAAAVLGSFGQTGVNQNVSQQTSITVQGSADANSTSKMVTDQQNRVNFDMTRNLKSSAR